MVDELEVVEGLAKPPRFVVVQGCPLPSDIGPYIAIVINDARATLNSGYRGHDAAWILNRHHKHSQDQLFAAWVAWSQHGVLLFGFTRANPPLPANRPGRSTHELRGDGVAFPGKVGTPLAWWQQGFDVNDSEVGRVMAAARRYGWQLFQPYHSGSEFHHLNFRVQPPRPRPGTALWARLWRLRATLPRS